MKQQRNVVWFGDLCGSKDAPMVTSSSFEKRMFGLKIPGSTPSPIGDRLKVDLRDILEVIGEPALLSHWRCGDLWYTTTKHGRFSELRVRRLSLSGKQLVSFAADVFQTIDGQFVAKIDGGRMPWLIILAVDSSWFEVWSSKPLVLEKLKERFVKVIRLKTTDWRPGQI